MGWLRPCCAQAQLTAFPPYLINRYQIHATLYPALRSSFSFILFAQIIQYLKPAQLKILELHLIIMMNGGELVQTYCLLDAVTGGELSVLFTFMDFTNILILLNFRVHNPDSPVSPTKFFGLEIMYFIICTQMYIICMYLLEVLYLNHSCAIEKNNLWMGQGKWWPPMAFFQKLLIFINAIVLKIYPNIPFLKKLCSLLNFILGQNRYLLPHIAHINSGVRSR